MATGRVPTTANSPLTAKGDLFTYSTAPARLAVGNNGDTIVADNSTATGLRWNTAANQNFSVNGGFDWWQRGTSFTGTSPYFTADRWQGYRDAGVAGSTFSRQTSGLDGFQYCMRAQRDNGNATSNQLNVAQSFETNDIRKFWGNYATVSFWARKGANYSVASSDINARLLVGTGTEGSISNGFTGGGNIGSVAAVLTTSWQKFSFTTSAVVANTSTQMTIGFLSGSLVGTAGAADYFEVAGVQLEIGQTATMWKRAGGTLQGELAACQRYYREVIFATGVSVGTTSIQTWINHTGMRTAPSVAASAPLKVTNASSTDYTQSVAGISIVGNVADGGRYTSANYTGMTTNQAANLINGGGYIQISAEL